MICLVQGGERNAHNHKELTYRTTVVGVLNLAWEVPNFFPQEFRYMNVAISDDSAEDIAHAFDEMADFIDTCRQVRGGGAVLVHCVQGISRSTSACLSYLMRREGWTLARAYEHVKALRPIMRPNKGFMRQLLAEEEELFGETTMDLDALFPADEQYLL